MKFIFLIWVKKIFYVLSILVICSNISNCNFIAKSNLKTNKINEELEGSSLYFNNDKLLTKEIKKEIHNATVLIKRGLEYSSGVIISHDVATNTYFVLTTRHSIEKPPSKMSIPKSYENPNKLCSLNQQEKSGSSKISCDFGLYYLYTNGELSDKKKISYDIDYSNVVKFSKNVDLAILAFISDKKYKVVSIASSQKIKKNSLVYISGYRGCDSPELDMHEKYQLSSGLIKENPSKSPNIFYTNSTINGMSGSGIFNAQGKLIGIHQRASLPKQYDHKICQSLEEQDNNLGNNFGIPISDFLKQDIPEKVQLRLCTGLVINSYCKSQ